MRCVLFVALLVPALAQAQDRFKTADDGAAAAAAAPAEAGSVASDAEKDASSQVDRSAEKYKRKTLLYFGAKPLGFQMWGLAALSGGNIFKVRWLSEMVGQKVGQATRLKRFDFVDLPWGTRPTPNVLKMFSEYIKSAKEDKAKAEADYLERYKSFDIKASDLARVMNSAYFYETELTKARIKRVKKRTCVKYKKKKVNGKMKKVCVKWKVKWVYVCTLGARTDFYHLKHQFPFSSKFASVAARSRKEKDSPRQACQAAANSVAGSISLRMRRIEEFRLKAPVVDVRKNATELGFNLGNKEGLRIDQGMYIVEYDAKNRRKKIGYSRVREVGNNEKVRAANSWAQRLTGSGDLGKQVLEDPSVGASFAFGMGTNVNANVAYNLGYLTNSAGLSETWFYAGFAYAASEPVNSDRSQGVSLGIKKLWYTGRFGVGPRVGVAFSEFDSDQPVTSVDAQGVVEMMLGGWGALQLQGGLTPVGVGGSAGLLFHF
jgi:hypothetical protein